MIVRTMALPPSATNGVPESPSMPSRNGFQASGSATSPSTEVERGAIDRSVFSAMMSPGMPSRLIFSTLSLEVKLTCSSALPSTKMP
jgi:hypothetical protein